MIKSISENFNKENSTKIKITSYFINTFIKINKIIYRKLYGEAKSAMITDFDEFIENYKLVLKEYDICDIFNFDETYLYIKNLGTRSYV